MEEEFSHQAEYSEYNSDHLKMRFLNLLNCCMVLFQCLITGQPGHVEESFPRKLRLSQVAVERDGGSVMEQLYSLGGTLQVKRVL